MVKFLKVNYIIWIIFPIQLFAQNDSFHSYSNTISAVHDSVLKAITITKFDSVHIEAGQLLALHLKTLRKYIDSEKKAASENAFETTLNHNTKFNSNDISAEEIEVALQYIKNASRTLRSELENKVGEDESDRILEPLNTLKVGQLKKSLKQSLNRLKKFEVKYGPNSAKLNILETVVNHFVLRGSDYFGVDDNGNPGPLEMILAYNASYFSHKNNNEDENKVIMIAVAEIGLRYYFFSERWGQGSYLKPAYSSFGLIFANGKNGALANPFGNKIRWGGFASWGDLKIAYIYSEDDSRFLLNKQFQYIPYIF